MSIYGEPDLADLLPAYCNYMTRCRQPQPCWGGIYTHLLAVLIGVSICVGGFYFYQFKYLSKYPDGPFLKPEVTETPPIQKEEDKKVEKKESKTSDNNNKAITQCLNPELTNEVKQLKDDISDIHTWKLSVDSLITKVQDEQDQKINDAIDEALEEFEADGIGLMDFAAAYAGGTIIEISKETYPYPTHRPLSLFRIVSVDVFSSPEEMIRPCVLPGSCFAFRGTQGAIHIKLGKPINIGGVTLSHASRLLLGLEGMASAPKDFELHGFPREYDNQGVYLGKFTYDWMGAQHQIFPIKKERTKDIIFHSILLTILSNHGKEEFTCIYRFRVHKRGVDLTGKEKPERAEKALPAKDKKKCC